MKSFQLDTESIHDAIESWPAILIALAISVFLTYAGWFNVTCRGILVVFAAVYFGYALRGVFARSLRAKYPNAKSIWLLSIGMTSVLLGMLARMLLPSLHGVTTDYVWIVVSFMTILAFVVINRHDPDVLK